MSRAARYVVGPEPLRLRVRLLAAEVVMSLGVAAVMYVGGRIVGEAK